MSDLEKKIEEIGKNYHDKRHKLENDYKQKIEKCEKECITKLEKVAEGYSQDVIIPFCEKYGLSHKGLMYAVWLVRNPLHGEIVSDSDTEDLNDPNVFPKEAISELKEIAKVLNTELSPFVYFGYYVKSF